jgi:hypothetical protein
MERSMTTLANLVEDCRQRYNAVGDNFFSDEELYDLVYEAEMEIATECEAIEEIYTTSTVASQREYDYPTRAMRIHRITYDGERLEPIDFLEDDGITGYEETTTSTGDPLYYAIFANRIFLRPVPASVATLKIYAIVMPSEHTAITSSMTVPEQYRPPIKDYILSQMFAKDKNGAMVSYHEGRWQRAVNRIKRFEMKRHVGDSYKVVKNCEDDTWG